VSVIADGPFAAGQHPAVGQLGKQVVDRVVEPEPALLDEDERGHRGDRLGHRRDAEDAVGPHRDRAVAVERAGGAGVHLAAPRHRPGQPGDVTRLDMAVHYVLQRGQPSLVEGHASSDGAAARDSSIAPDTDRLRRVLDAVMVAERR
jgi:hypothetical protein